MGWPGPVDSPRRRDLALSSCLRITVPAFTRVPSPSLRWSLTTLGARLLEMWTLNATRLLIPIAVLQGTKTLIQNGVGGTEAELGRSHPQSSRPLLRDKVFPPLFPQLMAKMSLQLQACDIPPMTCLTVYDQRVSL